MYDQLNECLVAGRQAADCCPSCTDDIHFSVKADWLHECLLLAGQLLTAAHRTRDTALQGRDTRAVCDWKDCLPVPTATWSYLGNTQP
jgi:hypothetical protein